MIKAEMMIPSDRLIVLGDFNLPRVIWEKYEYDNTVVLVPLSEAQTDSCFLNEVSCCGLSQKNSVRNFKNRTLDLIFVDDMDSFDVSRCASLVSPEDKHHPSLKIDIINLPIKIPHVTMELVRK